MLSAMLKVSELFYSIQGEGARAGTANVFVRLQGCKAQHACFASGIRCDTEFESGREWSLEGLTQAIGEFGCKNIIWTGGEPAQQLTQEIVQHFADLGYYQAIETSGLFQVPSNLDYVVVSPKVAEHVVEKNFGLDRKTPSGSIDELRYVRHKGQEIPQPSVTAEHMYISPHSDGYDINTDNLKHCIALVKANPEWKLSVQTHKLWRVL